MIVPSSADCCFLSTRGAEREQRSESSCRSARGRFVISSHELQPAENQRKSCFARYAGCPSERRYSASSSGSMDFISIFSVSSAISSHTAIEKAVRIIFLRQYEPLLLADKVRMIVKKSFRNILVFLMENGAGGIKKDPTRPDARGKSVRDPLLYCRETGKRFGVLIADLRLFADNAHAGARTVRNDKIEGRERAFSNS